MDGLPSCPRCRDLEEQVAALQRRVAELSAQVEKLTAALEAAQREGKRQAAPFRKADGPPPEPKKPGSQARAAAWSPCSPAGGREPQSVGRQPDLGRSPSTRRVFTSTSAWKTTPASGSASWC